MQIATLFWGVFFASGAPEDPVALAFDEVAPGVWRAAVGSPEAFDLLSVAGCSPRLEALAELDSARLPFAEGEVTGWARGGRAALRLPLAEGEDIYGLGLDFQRVRQNGTIQTLQVDHWGGRSGRTHAPVPFYVSSRGYGVLVNCARYLRFYVGTGLRRDSERPPQVRDRNRDRAWEAHPAGDSVEVLIPTRGAEILVFAGPTPLDAVRRYVLYCGGGCLPPKWGLGFTHRTPTRYTDQQLLAEVAEFRDRGFPLDFIGIEPGWHSHAYPCSFEWDEERFPKPGKLLELLAAMGVRVNLWMNPYVCPGTDLHEELLPYAGSHRVWNGIVPDYELPQAREIFGTHLGRVTLDLGVAGFKIDEVDGFDRWLWPDVARFPSGLDAEQIRQTYGLRVQRVVADLYRSRDRRTFGLVRGSNAGSAPLPFVLYNDHYSHQDFITALINSSFCGVLWTPEVRGSKSAEEWLRRMQTVCFSPMAMLNAWADGTKPWTFPEVEAEVREVALRRMQMLPYLYSAFAEYHFQGVPPVRAMPLVPGFADAADEPARRRSLGTQFLVGRDLLVAPLFAGETQREVVLPEGDWYDFHSGKRVGAGESIRVEPPDRRIPLFVRDGGLIPLMDARVHAPAPAERVPLQVRHYGRTPGRMRLYDDDGESFAFERGEFTWTELSVVRTEGGALAGRVAIPDGGPPFSYAPVTWRFMTRESQ